MDNDQIIGEVFSRPALWDKKNRFYHNRVFVEKLWVSIARKLKVPKQDLKKRWKHLRDQFRNELRKNPITKSGDTDNPEPEITSSWRYFQSLLFLKNQMKYKTFSGDLMITNTKNNSKEADIEFQEENEDVCNVSQIENTDEMYDSPALNSELSGKKSSTAANCSAQLLEIEKRKLDLLEKKASAKKTALDEDEAFFLTLLPHIRKLEPENKFLCRMEIQNVLYKYVYGKILNIPQMTKESTQYASVSSPIGTSSDVDLSTTVKCEEFSME